MLLFFGLVLASVPIRATEPYYDIGCDVNDDGYIGIDDTFIAASHFGQEE